MSSTKKWKALKVDEFTSPSAYHVFPDSPLDHVIDLMVKEGIRHVPVLKNGSAEVVGIISDRDVNVQKRLYPDRSLSASDVMKKNPYVVPPETPIEEVAFQMSKNKIGSAIVQSPSKDFLGIFTSTDALNALIEIIRDEIL